jgi:hypothetical protein
VSLDALALLVRGRAVVAVAALAGMLNPVSKITCNKQRKLLHGSDRKKGARRILVLLGKQTLF